MDKHRIVQIIELEIMKEIDRICKKHNIEYFAIGGTLLGSIRHKGFIPWDDDIDLGMSSENYDKFLSVVNNELDDKYLFHTWNDETQYALPISKVMMRGTHVVETFSKHVLANNGIWVDIFCYDLVPNCVAFSKNYNRYLRFLARINLIKHNYNPSVLSNKRATKALNKILKYVPVNAMFAKEMFIKALDKRNNYRGFDNDTFVERDNMYNADFVFPYDVIYPLRETVFENLHIPCPNNPDKYLRKAYGDYMKLPPEDERVAHLVENVFFDENFLESIKIDGVGNHEDFN